MAPITALSAVDQVAEHLRETLLRGANQVHVFHPQRDEDVLAVHGSMERWRLASVVQEGGGTQPLP